MGQFTDGTNVPLKSDTFRSFNAVVTPELAKKWLGTQTLNRNVQTHAMLGYRTDMINGLWSFTGDPLRFDINGHLIDGQNRLEALGGITVPNFALPFVVQIGLPPEAQQRMDQGARRTAGQQLFLKGIPSGSNLAAAIRFSWKWERGELFGGNRTQEQGTAVTNAQVVNWIDQHRSRALRSLDDLNFIRSSGLRPNIGLAFSLRAGANDLSEEVTVMFTEMHELTNLSASSPTLALVKRIQRVKASPDLTMNELDHLGFLICTWNAWVSGKGRTRLQRPKGGWSAENFPTPDGMP